LDFVLPNAVSLEVEAEVVWAGSQDRAGMRFLELPRLANDQLQAWLDSKMTQHQLVP